MNFIKRIFRRDFSYIVLLSLILFLLAGLQNPIIPFQILRVVLGLAFVLFFPGYCLMAAAYPARQDLDGKARLAFSFGLSLVIMPSLALLLDWTPWGITMWSILIGTLFVDMLLIGLTLLRQHSISEEDRFLPLRNLDFRNSWNNLDRKLKAGYLAVIFLVLAFSVVAYTIIAFPAPAERMTEFYMLGDEGLAEGYPYQLVVDQAYISSVGINNREGKTMTYTLKAHDASGVIGELGPLTLQDDESSEFDFSFTPRTLGEGVEINFYLYQAGVAEPYRKVRLITDVVTAGGLP